MMFPAWYAGNCFVASLLITICSTEKANRLLWNLIGFMALNHEILCFRCKHNEDWEHIVHIDGVVGSSPTVTTKKSLLEPLSKSKVSGEDFFIAFRKAPFPLIACIVPIVRQIWALWTTR